MAITHPDWLAHVSQWEQQSRLRTLHLSEGIDFYSNDYLGLARSTTLQEQLARAEANFAQPVHGATGSRLLSGHSALANEVETELAQWLQAEAGLFFGSGYTANLAVLSTLPQKGDTILYDQYAHACLKDGARLSMAQRFSFRHNDLDDLRKKLAKATGTVYVIVESVYSMDGDQAPLVELVALCEEAGALLVVDEAHSTGLYGKLGRGLCTQLGLTDRVAVRIHTFGKAMGTHGAMVVGSTTLRQVLINAARAFIYTTAPPPHQWLAAREAIRYLRQHHHTQWTTLQQNIAQFRQAAPTAALLASHSPIQGLVIPGNQSCRQAATALQAAGFAVRPILSPTVPKGQERIRICLHSYNSKEEITQLAASLHTL